MTVVSVRSQTSKVLPSRQHRWVPICISIILLIVLSAGVRIAYARRHANTLTYVAYPIANPESGDCMGAVGLYSGLQAQVPKRPKTEIELKKLADANTPSGVSIKIGKAVYRLDLDRSTSGYGNEQVAWNFKLVRLSKVTALSLIGKRAVIRYRIGSRAIATSPTVVADGRCKSLI